MNCQQSVKAGSLLGGFKVEMTSDVDFDPAVRLTTAMARGDCTSIEGH
jgi:hypothetical protein